MLQNFFGDDEHTAADGPYARVMKTRKWLYISAVVATAYNLGLLKPDKVQDVLVVVSLPDEIIRWATLSACLYLIVVYAALVFQLLIVYDIILSDRLRFRKDDEIAGAQQKVDESKKEVIRLDGEKRRHTSLGARIDRERDYSAEEHDAATLIYNRNVESLRKIIASDPADRRFFREIEVGVDALRVVGPLIMAAIAVYFLVFK